MRFGVGHKLLAAQQIPLAPRRNDLDVRIERIGAQLETHLVVALAGGTMGNRIGIGFTCNLDQALGNQWACYGSAEQIFALVNGIGMEHGKNEIAHEFLAQVVDINFLHAEFFGFFARRFQLFTLADVSGKRHYLALIDVCQPRQDDRGIQTARVGKHYFANISFLGFIHYFTFPNNKYSIKAFCTCSRFSASSHTTDCGPSMTSAATSSPRCAGRQCMNNASLAATFIMSASTCQSAKSRRRSSFSASKPIEVQTSVVTRSAPLAASIGSANSS